MKNFALLLILLFVQFNISKSDKFINPDGGEWITIDSVPAYYEGQSNAPSYYFNLSCFDSLNCVGHYGDFMSATSFSIIRKTSDGGKTWIDIRKDISPSSYPVKRFLFYPEKEFIIIGCDSGYVLRSTDGGENWDFSQKITTLEPKYFQLNNMYMKGKIGIVSYSGKDNVFLTEDGGITWTKMQFNTNPFLEYPGANFSICDSNTILMSSIVRNDNDTSMYLFKSKDKGKTWIYINKISEQVNYYSFFNFLNQNLGYSRFNKRLVKGDFIKKTQDTTYTSFFKTTDGGKFWVKLYEIIEEGTGYGTLSIADSLNFMITKQSGAHLRTTDGGKSWTKNPAFTFGDIFNNGLCFTNTFLSPTTPLIGFGPKILKYVGKSTSINLQKPENVKFIIYPNPANDFITIQISEVFKTSEVCHIQIFNVFGIEVGQSSMIDDNNRINISHLSAGVYYIRIGDETEMFVKM